MLASADVLDAFVNIRLRLWALAKARSSVLPDMPSSSRSTRRQRSACFQEEISHGYLWRTLSHHSVLAIRS